MFTWRPTVNLISDNISYTMNSQTRFRRKDLSNDVDMGIGLNINYILNYTGMGIMWSIISIIAF